MGDANILPIIFTAVTSAAVAVAGMYAFVLRRESEVRKEMKEMHKDQDCRIEKAEKKAQEITDNYNRKFQGVHERIHESESKMIAVIHELENTMRDSNHNLAENVTKALNRLEMSMNKPS